MNVKKSLENRVRGWLPKEPKISSYPQKSGQKESKAGVHVWISLFTFGCVIGLLAALGFSELTLYLSIFFVIVGSTIVVVTKIISAKKEKLQRSTKT